MMNLRSTSRTSLPFSVSPFFTMLAMIVNMIMMTIMVIAVVKWWMSVEGDVSEEYLTYIVNLYS